MESSMEQWYQGTLDKLKIKNIIIMEYKKIAVSKKAPNKNCLWLKPITIEGEIYYSLLVFGSKGWESISASGSSSVSLSEYEETEKAIAAALNALNTRVAAIENLVNNSDSNNGGE